MKRTYALLLAAMMTAFSLAACGSGEGNSATGSDSTNGAGSGSSAADGSGENGAGIANGDAGGLTGGSSGAAGSNNAADSDDAADSGRSADGALTGGVEDAARDMEDAVSDATGGMLRGASYEQMLRNAHVHDTDGNLYDYENAMTPGTRYF